VIGQGGGGIFGKKSVAGNEIVENGKGVAAKGRKK